LNSPLVFRIYKNDQIFVVKQFVNDERIVLGHGPGVHIDLPSTEVSAIHCLVEKRGNTYFLCDLGSEQGTFVDEQQVLDQELQSGDAFQLGPYKVFFMVGNQKNIELEQKDKAFEGQAQERPAATPKLKKITPVPAANLQKAEDHKARVFAAAAGVKPAVAKASHAKPGALKDFVRVGNGSILEVIVSWREHIVNTYHFNSKEAKVLGSRGDIVVPDGAAPLNWKLISAGNAVEINTTPEMKVEILREGNLQPVKENKFILSQSEVCFIELVNGMQLAIRFAPRAPPLLFDSPFVLGISEFTGVLAALIIAVMTSIIVSVNKPKPPVEEEIAERQAQVIFTKPPVPIKIDLADTPQPTPPPPQEKPKEVVKMDLSDKKEAPKAASNAGKAAEVKPKDSKLKTKMFTSVKSGGAVKTGETNAANAKSKEPDVKNTGLLAAFGSGGARNKLDKAYSGSGELIGAGEKATGSSGFNSNRSGDDLGSKVKDTGAGGAGTATQGIAGVGTVGRSGGMDRDGTGTGFGDKGKVNISAGGNEEAFTGSIDKEAVRRVVKAALREFKACYEREYRMNSKLEGKVVISWEIHEQGVAKNASVVRAKSTINNAAVEDCVKNRMLALKFPEPPAGTTAEVTYPFIFQGQKL
jgi:pSer/pThr/pTyr-binding forkhead associated (FHA) protein